MIRLPGVAKPGADSPYRFELKPAYRGIGRASFDGAIPFSRSALLRFELYTPTSRFMYPDIVKGDVGFPVVALRNEKGSVYRFARGNLKDFFDIENPNKPQIIELPVSAFVYDKDLSTNVPDNGKFFDFPIVGLYFDFLCHPEEVIDIHLGKIEFLEGETATGHTVQDLVIFERIGQAKQLPPWSSENGAVSLGISLSNAGLQEDLRGAELRLVVKSEAGNNSYLVKLGDENVYLTLKLDRIGPYTIAGEIVRNGVCVARSQWPACRVLPRLAQGGSTLLGISDEYEYDRIAALGGSADRLPVTLRATVFDKTTGPRFSTGTNPFPNTLLKAGAKRYVAPFAMPKWLSREPDRPDHYRYGPSDWVRFGGMTDWIATAALDAGATHYEVWNEASAIGHWNDSIENLVELHRVTFETVKRAAPSMVVLGGCTHSWTFDFLRKFLEAGGARYCDGLAIHGYTYQPHEFVEQFDGIDSLIAEFAPERPDFKAYVTEIGFRYPAFSLENQAKYFALYTIEGASRSTIGAMLWFRYTNPRPEILSGYRQNSSTGYALVGHNGSYCRPSFAAYRFVERLLQQFDDIRASGPATARRYEFVKNGSVEAVGLYQPEGEPDLPAGWTVLDQYGAPLEGHADLRVAVSPGSAHLLR